jgi:hypothetical protein
MAEHVSHATPSRCANLTFAVYLGTSSNWSFTRRVLSLAHQHLYHDALPTEALLFDETTYQLGWDGLRTTPGPDVPVVPTRDHTMYLINAVQFRCGQLYHLFEETDFMSSLQRFYSGEAEQMTNSLWYIHFLLILAFGKGFVQPKAQGKKPPGVGYFIRALQLLPDPSALYRDPMLGTEILCCIALYYQCVDYRTSAHNYVRDPDLLSLSTFADNQPRLVKPCGLPWHKECTLACLPKI